MRGVGDHGSLADPFPELIRYLPMDFPRDGMRRTDHGRGDTSISDEAVARYLLGAESISRLRKAGRALGVTNQEFLLTGFAALILRLTCQERVVIAASIETSIPIESVESGDGPEFEAGAVGREAPKREVEHGLAQFHFEGASSFADVVGQSSTGRIASLGGELEARFATEIGFQYPAADLRSPRGSSEGQGSTGAAARTTAFPSRPYALCLKVRESAAGLELRLVSTTGLWSTHTLGRWLQYLDSLLEAAAEDPATPVGQLRLSDAESTQDFHHLLNHTPAEYPRELCVHAWIAQQCERSPEAIAIRAETGHQACTYRELDRRSTVLAKRLAEGGARPGRSVAVCMQRTLNLPVTLLAILKSGACYVPLDPQHPEARLQSVLEECDPVAVVSDRATAEKLRATGWGDDGRLICADEFFAREPKRQNGRPAVPGAGTALEGGQPVELIAATPEDAAYTIYTSGSTGKPKGVVIRHRALMNLLWAMRNQPGMHNQDRLLAITTISFDIATMDMFLPLCVGGALVVAAEESAADPARLARLIEEEGITLLQATPVTWRMLTASGWRCRPGLKMISGGEALARDLADQLIEAGGELWNCYGPTETTIYSSVVRVTAGQGIVPLGPPIANTSFFVVDEAGHLLPPGVAGELYIGGDGVSPGYVARPELTRERFVTFPASVVAEWAGQPVFRTGDLVRVLPGNQLEFFGRRDNQVKLRGYRIELGEIEWVLRTHPAVGDAAVLLEEAVPGEPELVAYVTSEVPAHRPAAQAGGVESGQGFHELRQHASLSLPRYMLPSRIHRLESMPLTGSGKIDRKQLHLAARLPQAEESGRAVPASVSPVNALEAKLLGIFRQVLRQPALGVTDSFFEYGGYSMLSVRLFHLINRHLGRKLPISLLFEAPTVRELAVLVSNRETLSHIVPIRRAGRMSESRAPLFFIHSYLLYRLMDQVIEPDRPLYGLRELPESAIYQAITDRAEAYAREIAATAGEWPVHLAGWCAAGPLTVEVARQLREMGYQVGLVALFDSELPGYKPSVAGKGNLLMAKLASNWSFHRERLGKLSLRDRAAYLRDAAQRRMRDWSEQMEEKLKAGYEGFQCWRHRHSLGGSAPALRDVVLHAWNERSKPYPGSIRLFRATDVPRLPELDQSLGWSEIAEDGVVVEFVDGHHESMFLAPHITGLSERLCRAMDGAEQELPTLPAKAKWTVHTPRFAG